MKVLVCTGGGCFCAAQASIIAGCVDFSKFDAFGGTSGGAINVLAANVLAPTMLPKFWSEYSERIFAGYWYRRYWPMCPKYPDKELNEALQRIVGYIPFGSIRKTVFVGAHDLNRGRPKVFSNADYEDASWMAWEVARMSASAQTYFDPWKGFADGGIFFNDPVMLTTCGLCKGSGVPFEEMEVFSIGSGLDSANYNRGTPKLYTQWLGILLTDMLRGGAVYAERYYAGCLPFKKYVHIDFPRFEGDMDNPDVAKGCLVSWKKEILEGIDAINAF